MANIKISELEELTAVADDDILPIVDISENETKKIKNSNLLNNVIKNTDVIDNLTSSIVDKPLSANQGKVLNEKIDSTVPIGVLLPFGGTTAPTNWLLCDGSAISRTTYADLFNVIGTSFGEGDGSTTFNLPNTKDNTLVGVNSEGNHFKTVGSTYGEETHTLTIEELAPHTHDTVIPYATNCTQFGYELWAMGNGGNAHTSTRENAAISKGGGQPFNVIQPSLAVNYIIKAL